MNLISSLSDYDAGIGREVHALRGFVALLSAATADNDAEEYLSGELGFVPMTAHVLVDALERKVESVDAQMRQQLGITHMKTE